MRDKNLVKESIETVASCKSIEKKNTTLMSKNKSQSSPKEKKTILAIAIFCRGSTDTLVKASNSKAALTR